jgi:predicted RNase H-like HicB family nuclease
MYVPVYVIDLPDFPTAEQIRETESKARAARTNALRLHVRNFLQDEVANLIKNKQKEATDKTACLGVKIPPCGSSFNQDDRKFCAALIKANLERIGYRVRLTPEGRDCDCTIAWDTE